MHGDEIVGCTETEIVGCTETETVGCPEMRLCDARKRDCVMHRDETVGCTEMRWQHAQRLLQS